MLSICFISSRQAEPLASGRLWRWLQEQNNNPGTQVSRNIPQIWNAWSTTGSFKNYPFFFLIYNRTGKLDAGKTNSFEYRRRENASSDRTWGDYNLLRTGFETMIPGRDDFSRTQQLQEAKENKSGHVTMGFMSFILNTPKCGKPTYLKYAMELHTKFY